MTPDQLARVERLRDEFVRAATPPRLIAHGVREDADALSALLREREALRAALELHINSMNDVVSIGRFSPAVDPVRLVTAWRDGLAALLTGTTAQTEGK